MAPSTTNSETALLAGVRERDVLSLVELFHRTLPAVHAVARRMVGDLPHVERLLACVYKELWTAPPEDGPVTAWLRARCFQTATQDLQVRDGVAGTPSTAAVLQQSTSVRSSRSSSPVERTLAEMSDTERMALLLAHDCGVPADDQEPADAATHVTSALIRIAEPDADVDASQWQPLYDRVGEWTLGVLSADQADSVAAAVAASDDLAAHAERVRRGLRRLEGLPPSSLTSQRVIAQVFASSAAEPAPLAEPVDDGAVMPRTANGLRPDNSRRLAAVLSGVATVFILLANVFAFGIAARPDAAATAAVAVNPPVADANPPTRAGAAQDERVRPPRTERRQEQRTSDEQPRFTRPANAGGQLKPAAPPVSLRIPKMDVNRRLVGLSVQANGTLASPTNYGDPGWYQEGVAPGERGPAVIVGHVDSLDGPAIFYDLQKLRPGDKAHVKRADGTTATFVIDRVDRFPKDNFPRTLVYGDTDRSELRLITCGGAFNNTTRHYDDNVVAFGHLKRATQDDDDRKSDRKNDDRKSDRKNDDRKPDRTDDRRRDGKKADKKQQSRSGQDEGEAAARDGADADAADTQVGMR